MQQTNGHAKVKIGVYTLLTIAIVIIFIEIY